MKINDRVYGFTEIKEEVLLDLIKTPTIQRLKKISQLGMPEEYMGRKVYSRYEHSLGTVILLKKFNATLDEQIAALLHDSPHTAFSHVIDWVLGDPTKENYHDEIYFSFLKKSEVPKILEKHNFDFKKVSDLQNFPLLEREAPSLCADRIDYSLREMALLKGSDFTRKIFRDLNVLDGQIIFKNIELANVFAKEYMKLQKESWAGDQARTRYFILAESLKKALKNNLISLEDLHKTDEYVLNILEGSEDKYIADNLNLLKNDLKIVPSKRGIKLEKKFRYIDPEVFFNGTYKKLSELSEDYFELINQAKKESKLVRKVVFFNGN